MCEADVATEDAPNGDKQSKGLRTISCHIESSTQEALRDDSSILPWLVEHAGCILFWCQKRRHGRTPFERLFGKNPSEESVPFGEKEGIVKAYLHRSHDQNESQIQIRNLARQCGTIVQNVLLGMQSEDWNLKTEGQRNHQQRN